MLSVIMTTEQYTSTWAHIKLGGAEQRHLHFTCVECTVQGGHQYNCQNNIHTFHVE